VAGPYRKSLDEPDESADYGCAIEEVVAIGDFTVGRVTQLPGFAWRTHIQPLVGGEWCLARHVGVILSGQLRVLLKDGTTIDLGPNDVFDIPPGHDSWVVGDEPCVELDWSGLEAWTGFRMRLRDRVLAGLLMSDIVDSTGEASRLGDAGWRRQLSDHHKGLRDQLGRFGGREIDTAGDGMFALFDGAARALECAAAFQGIARRQGLPIRVGVHVGEVEVGEHGARGIAVHEVARIAGAAAPGETWLSETTVALTGGAGLKFDDRGQHELKGIQGPRHLYAYLAGAS
jgi:class 3 adenylate cyclase